MKQYFTQTLNWDFLLKAHITFNLNYIPSIKSFSSALFLKKSNIIFLYDKKGLKQSDF